MRVLLDNNIDQRFARLLTGHEVVHSREMGWAELFNGDLIAQAEQAGFSVLITGDKRMRYQQSLSGRRISIVTLNPVFVDMLGIAPLAPQVLEALEQLVEGSFLTISPADRRSGES